LSTFGFTTGIIVDGSLSRGINQTRTPNPNIRWEVSENFNAGIELEFDQGKWSLEADWFMNNRSNILTQRSASLPLYVGFGLPDENIGTSTNRGFEAIASYRNVFGDFYLNVSANAM